MLQWPLLESLFIFHDKALPIIITDAFKLKEGKQKVVDQFQVLAAVMTIMIIQVQHYIIVVVSTQNLVHFCDHSPQIIILKASSSITRR